MMERLPELAAFARFRKIGGVVDHSIFGNAEDNEETLEQALESHFAFLADNLQGEPCWFDPEALQRLPRKRIEKAEFLGDWYDSDREALIMLGSGTAEGDAFQNPTYRELGNRKITNWASSLAMPGEGGGYAYACIHPPYGLRYPRDKVQTLFNAMVGLILPRGEESRITSWLSPELIRLSNYFDAGSDWWGMFLYTVYTVPLRQLTVISVSATD